MKDSEPSSLFHHQTTNAMKLDYQLIDQKTER